MSLTSKLGLELLSNSASNYLLANKTFFQLSQAVQLTVVSKSLATPPGSPADGDAYIVAGSPTGAWTGKAGQIAYWQTAAADWTFIVPDNGWTAWVTGEGVRYELLSGVWVVFGSAITSTQSIIIACGDETTETTAGTAKVTFRMPYAFTLSAVRASLTIAQTSGSIFTVDINEGGASILSTKLTIDNTEKTSTTAATAAVMSDTALANDAEITIDVDQIGDGTAKGLKVYLIGVIA